MTNLNKNNNKLLEHLQSIANQIQTGIYETENEDGPNGFDYLEDALDIQYIIDSKKNYLGARVLVAFGGPNIWINTKEKTIEGYWWEQTEFAYYTQDNLDLDFCLEEIYNCM
tara:strand:+ start:298 stop:633 length:336 start_codon:yes stop_codon:yes gene_type:complete